MDATPGEPPAETPGPQRLRGISAPPLEQLLPRAWRGDRRTLDAWQKGRGIAAAGGVAWGAEGSQVAAVASRSEEAPRAVDLAGVRCSCPNARAFCSHLFAAVEARCAGGGAQSNHSPAPALLELEGTA